MGVQVILCTKEMSIGARKNAYTLLVEIGNAFERFCGTTKGEDNAKCFIFYKLVTFIFI